MVTLGVFAYRGSRSIDSHAMLGMTPIISSTGSCQVLCVSLNMAMVLRGITPHDREGPEASSHARHERELLSRGDEKDQKESCLSLCLRHFVRSWGVFAPLRCLYGGQESCAMPPDHAKLRSQEMSEHAEVRGAIVMFDESGR